MTNLGYEKQTWGGVNPCKPILRSTSTSPTYPPAIERGLLENPPSWSICIWVNYNNSQTWIKAIWGWFPSLAIIPVRENSEVIIIYPYIYIYIIIIYNYSSLTSQQPSICFGDFPANPGRVFFPIVHCWGPQVDAKELMRALKPITDAVSWRLEDLSGISMINDG